MARGDGKAVKGKTRGKLPVKRMLLGGSVDGPAPSNASSMRSGYAGGPSTGGNNFGAGGGGLGSSSREGGFGGAGAGRLESPGQRSSIRPGAGNVVGGASPRDGGFAGAGAGRLETPNARPTQLPGPGNIVGSWGNTNFDKMAREVADDISAMSRRGLAPADPMAANTSMVRNAMLAAGPTYSNPSATPVSDFRAPPTTPSQTFESLNNSFQRKAAQFMAEGTPTGFRGTPGSQYFGGQVPAPPRDLVGGSYNSANRTGRPAGAGGPEITGQGFPQGLADRGPSRLTNVSETPSKITDRFPGVTGPTTGPDFTSYGGKTPATQPQPAGSKPGFGAGEPPSDRGSARGEGGRNKRRPVERRERMASGGYVRGDGRSRITTKGKMV
jgi:hypothetical protein